MHAAFAAKRGLWWRWGARMGDFYRSVAVGWLLWGMPGSCHGAPVNVYCDNPGQPGRCARRPSRDTAGALFGSAPGSCCWRDQALEVAVPKPGVGGAMAYAHITWLFRVG